MFTRSLTDSSKMSKCSAVSLRAQNGDCKNRQGPGSVTTHSREPRERPLSTVCISNATQLSHQLRWSADFGKCKTSPVVTVRKNKKEPQPPQRGVSLLQPNTKCYSCPPMGVYSSLRHSSSCSSSSSTSSCSSPPPVQTKLITGHDPLGWKLRPKSSSTSSRARANRLSLQIPLPVIVPPSSPTNSQSDITPNPDPSPRTKPPLRPKPSRRHSDSSALLSSLANPRPLVTLEDLCAVLLRPVSLSDESDDVFSGDNEEDMKAIARSPKIPPPVPEKTATARQIAQLIAHSRRGYKTNDENIYTSVIKPKAKHSLQTEDHSRQHERKTAGLCVDTSCDRDRSTPRFPG